MQCSDHIYDHSALIVRSKTGRRTEKRRTNELHSQEKGFRATKRMFARSHTCFVEAFEVENRANDLTVHGYRRPESVIEGPEPYAGLVYRTKQE